MGREWIPAFAGMTAGGSIHKMLQECTIQLVLKNFYIYRNCIGQQ